MIKLKHWSDWIGDLFQFLRRVGVIKWFDLFPTAFSVEIAWWFDDWDYHAWLYEGKKYHTIRIPL